MASGRSVAARAKLLYQHKRALPSLSQRVHSNDDDHEKPKPKRPTPSSYSQGSLLEGRNNFRKFHGSRSLLFQDWRFMAPATCGTISVRNMSSTGVGSSNKIGIMSDEIDYHTDNSVELVSQAYSMSVRNMSSTGVGSSNRIGIMSDVIDYHTDNSVELVSQAYSISPEVAAAAADSFYPVRGLMYLFDYVHINTGLNWWLTIAGVTLLIRLLHVPFSIHEMKSNLKYDLLKPQLRELRKEMEYRDMSPAAEAEWKAKRNKLFKEFNLQKLFYNRHGVSDLTPVKGILVRGLIFWTFFFAIKNMVEKVPSFKEGGTLWFTDLTTPDTLYIFPVLTAFTFSIVTQLNAQESMKSKQGTEDSLDPDDMIFITMFSMIFAVLTVPFIASLPKAMFCYWITSQLFRIAFRIVIMKPEVRKWLDMPGISVTSPPSNGVNSDFSFTGVIKKDVDDQQKFGAMGSQVSSAPPAEESTKPVTRRIPGLSVLSQRIKILEKRIKILEKEVKGRKKEKKN